MRLAPRRWWHSIPIGAALGIVLELVLSFGSATVGGVGSAALIGAFVLLVVDGFFRCLEP